MKKIIGRKKELESLKKIWKSKGVQIDLLFDRQDNAVTLCEIKYSANRYVIDKSYAKDLPQTGCFPIHNKNTQTIIPGTHHSK